MRAQQGILSDDSDFARARRLHQATGDHSSSQAPVEKIVKGLVQDDSGYLRRFRGAPQVPLIASAVAEPDSNHTVDMLQALPESESLFYGKEANVISTAGKCFQHLTQLAEQFGFYGGSMDEVINKIDHSTM